MIIVDVFWEQNFFALSQNENQGLILDHLWIINIYEKILREVRRYFKRGSIKSQVVSLPVLYLPGKINFRNGDFPFF